MLLRLSRAYHTTRGFNYYNNDNLLKDNIIDLVNTNPKLACLIEPVLYKRLYKIIYESNEELKIKQLNIENEIHNFNKSAFEELIKTPQMFYNKMGLNLLINTINTLDLDLTSYKKSKHGNYKNYWFFLFNTQNSEIISIVLSNVIPFIFKNSEFISLKVTSLYKKVGKK